MTILSSQLEKIQREFAQADSNTDRLAVLNRLLKETGYKDLNEYIVENRSVVIDLFENAVSNCEIEYFNADEDLPKEMAKAAENWMRENQAEYYDCGELDCTSLAIDCGNDLGLFTDSDCTIHPYLFEFAAKCEEEMGDGDDDDDDDDDGDD